MTGVDVALIVAFIVVLGIKGMPAAERADGRDTNSRMLAKGVVDEIDRADTARSSELPARERLAQRRRARRAFRALFILVVIAASVGLYAATAVGESTAPVSGATLP